MRRCTLFLALAATLPLASLGWSSSVKTITLGTPNVCSPRALTGSVTLSTPAPAAGQEVDFTSTTAFLTTPTPIIIPAGQSTGAFTYSFSGGSKTDTYAVISAATVGSKISAVQHIYAPRAIKSLALINTYLSGGLYTFGNVTLTATNPAEQDITISNSGPGSSDPTLTIPPNSTSNSYPIIANTVSANTLLTSTVSCGVGSSASATATVIPGWNYSHFYNNGNIGNPGTQPPVLSPPILNFSNGNVTVADWGELSFNGVTGLSLNNLGQLLWSTRTSIPANSATAGYIFYPRTDGSFTSITTDNNSGPGNLQAQSYSASGTALPSYTIGSPGLPLTNNPMVNGDLGFYTSTQGITLNGTAQTSSWTWQTPSNVAFTSAQATSSNTIYGRGNTPNSTFHSTVATYLVEAGVPDPTTKIRPIQHQFIGPAGTLISDPVLYQGYLYATSLTYSDSSSTVTAFNPDLTVKWQYSTGEALTLNGKSVLPPEPGPNLIYVLTPTRILAIRPSNGTLAWQAKNLSVTTATNNDTIAPAPDGSLFECNQTSNGSKVMTVRAFTPGGSQKWRHDYTDRSTLGKMYVGPDSTVYLYGAPTNARYGLMGFTSSGSAAFNLFLGLGIVTPSAPIAFFPDGTAILTTYDDTNYYVNAVRWTP